MPRDIRADVESDSSRDAASLFLDLVTEHLEDTRVGAGRVSTTRSVEEIASRFDEPLPTTGAPLGDVVRRVARDVIADANHLTHPMYMGHQVSAPLPAAIWTEPVISALNNSLAVREMSPTLTAIETRIVRWMSALVGYSARAGGTFTTGGTEATFMHPPESNILCFRWIGSIGKSQSSLDDVNRELRERYNRSGRGWITSTVLDGRRVLRVTLMNPRTNEEHVIRLIGGLAEEAQRLL